MWLDLRPHLRKNSFAMGIKIPWVRRCHAISKTLPATEHGIMECSNKWHTLVIEGWITECFFSLPAKPLRRLNGKAINEHRRDEKHERRHFENDGICWEIIPFSSSVALIALPSSIPF